MAATKAIGARVIAQSASPYDPNVHTPPMSPLAQWCCMYRIVFAPWRSMEIASNGTAVSKSIQPV